MALKPDKSEPQPLDPKKASKLIQRHLETRRASRKETEARIKKSAPKPPPPDDDAEDLIQARSVSADEIVDLLQQTSELLSQDWIKENDEHKPLRGRQVSWAEIEIVIGRQKS